MSKVLVCLKSFNNQCLILIFWMDTFYKDGSQHFGIVTNTTMDQVGDATVDVDKFKWCLVDDQNQIHLFQR